MIGHNTLNINEATICVAVQMYLDSLTKEGVSMGNVTGVKEARNTLGNSFDVRLEERKEDTDGDATE